ncbi:MAG TPA: transposase [Patescibacteria group bacterium]|nr:transposase [Patescibacteria group bacterium]
MTRYDGRNKNDVVPTKNTIKTYLENAYYHVYNRGVDKREIFLEKADCIIFQHFLKLYLSPPEFLIREKEMTPKLLYKVTNLNLFNEVDLLSFSIMPNHFHLQVKQHSKNGMEKLTRRVLSSYSQYFNKKYRRKGPLFESAYKAVLLTSTEQFLYLSSYIHRNPIKLKNPKFDFIEFSSYPYYLGEKNAVWLKQKEILDYFRYSRQSKNNKLLSYENFVHDFKEEPKEVLGDLVLEEDY